jgi:proline iminopeptidase
VRDLEALLSLWRLGPATVVGYSWGALLALLHAVTYPGRIGRLVLVAPAPLSSEERAEFERRLASRGRHPWIVERRRELERSGLRRRDPAAFRREAFQLSVAPYFKDPTRADRVAPFVVALRAREAIWRSLGAYDLSRALEALTIETLVLHGRHDPIPVASAERIAASLGARFEIFPDSGHVPFVEESDRFISVLGGFLPRSDA